MSTKALSIVTHNGPFHADEVFAIAAFYELADRYPGMYDEIIVTRTRDEALVAAADCCIDVGGVYDEQRLRFDHHQRGFDLKRENEVPYASFGLVWKLIGAVLCDSPSVAQRVDADLIIGIDAADAGFSLSTPRIEGVHSVSISGLISRMNPGWKANDPEAQNHAFSEAVEMARSILRLAIEAAVGLEEAAVIIAQAVRDREISELVVLDDYAPWQNAIFTMGDFHDAHRILYVVYPNTEGSWMVQSVPERVGSFSCKKPLPEPWRGLRSEALTALTGVPAVFAHPNGFIAGAPTREDAVALAALAIAA